MYQRGGERGGRAQQMAILATDGPEIDFDKINQNYSLATNSDAYDTKGKQDEGVKTETTDIQKARKYILERMQMEPEAEELLSEMRRQEKLQQMQGAFQKKAQKKQESAKDRIVRIQKELKDLTKVLNENKDQGDMLDELKSAVEELQTKDLSSALPQTLSSEIERLKHESQTFKEELRPIVQESTEAQQIHQLQILSVRIRALSASKVTSSFSVERRFKNLIEFLTYLQRLFRLSKEGEINKVNQKAINLNGKIEQFVRQKKKAAKSKHQIAASDFLSKKRPHAQFWNDLMKKGGQDKEETEKQQEKEAEKEPAQKASNKAVQLTTNPQTQRIIDLSKETSIALKTLPRMMQRVAVQSRGHDECADVLLRTESLKDEVEGLERMLKSGKKLQQNLSASMRENRTILEENMKRLKERVENLKMK